MPEQGKPAVQFVPSLGNWYTPTQRDKAFMTVWTKITKEEFNYEEALNAPTGTYFNRPTAVLTHRSEYDQRFHFENRVDVKAAREDRQNLNVIFERVHEEEKARVVPLCASQNYGHRKTELEGRSIAIHKRKDAMRELVRRNNVNMKPRKKFPPELTIEQL